LKRVIEPDRTRADRWLRFGRQAQAFAASSLVAAPTGLIATLWRTIHVSRVAGASQIPKGDLVVGVVVLFVFADPVGRTRPMEIGLKIFSRPARTADCEKRSYPGERFAP
jgi:hypothetical protein